MKFLIQCHWNFIQNVSDWPLTKILSQWEIFVDTLWHIMASLIGGVRIFMHAHCFKILFDAGGFYKF